MGCGAVEIATDVVRQSRGVLCGMVAETSVLALALALAGVWIVARPGDTRKAREVVKEWKSAGRRVRVFCKGDSPPALTMRRDETRRFTDGRAHRPTRSGRSGRSGP